ncbi:DUF1513 domain-containing protein [Celeribacter indicus]|uniref:Twin-arginine translocation pathway signal n=1 Tax=Celeribacter indicus TaxID=1208324 RepID=A0A0B5DXN4_9RHOB|nr:DUF1513 domain-containing protein [Celeribacter indicus]AJE47754.1 hypothetical protein P73_3039 [Celeribacter indicus]SDW21857.1 hypothetical protein SAMN05443573_10223 [Celeribacter indicus]
MTDRRTFLKAAFATAFVPRLSWADAGSPAYLGAARDASGDYALYGLDAAAQIVFRVPLPARGHAAAAHPAKPEAVAFARRPGTFALVVNCATGDVTHRLDAPEGRHFMGHGLFVNGGDLLLTPENHYAAKRGILGLWDRTKGYARIGEVPTHGIGPHDVKQLSDGTLVVANGGIFTHPEIGAGREKLNLDGMKPSLAYLTSGYTLVEKVALAPELHRNSIRHLSVGPGDQIAFAMQWEGDETEVVPLLGLHRRGEAPVLAQAELGEQFAMRGYAGSVAHSGDGTEVAITSPRGGRLHRFAPDGRFLGAVQRGDICGLAPCAAGYLGSDGFGALVELRETMRPLNAVPGLAWDNHLVALPQLL